MRKHALEKGFTLNEYSLRRVDANGRAGKPLHIKSEKEIFDYLEMDYKRPDERNMD
jgi:DNA polymerase beta